jgi:hypothetical protein
MRKRGWLSAVVISFERSIDGRPISSGASDYGFTYDESKKR